jgi:hypothetical protein
MGFDQSWLQSNESDSWIAGQLSASQKNSAACNYLSSNLF